VTTPRCLEFSSGTKTPEEWQDVTEWQDDFIVTPPSTPPQPLLFYEQVAFADQSWWTLPEASWCSPVVGQWVCEPPKAAPRRHAERAMKWSNAAESRASQTKFKDSSQTARVEFSQELRGHIVSMCFCPHGNHLLQQIVSLLHWECVQSGGTCDFIVCEILSDVCGIAQHACGCRVIQRLLEHCDIRSPYDPMHFLVQFLCDSTLTLAAHPYGNHVISRLLERTELQHYQTQVIMHLSFQATEMACHERANHVIQSCLQSQVACKDVLADLLLTEEGVQAMRGSVFGRHVLLVLRASQRWRAKSTMLLGGGALEAAEEVLQSCGLQGHSLCETACVNHKSTDTLQKCFHNPWLLASLEQAVLSELPDWYFETMCSPYGCYFLLAAMTHFKSVSSLLARCLSAGGRVCEASCDKFAYKVIMAVISQGAASEEVTQQLLESLIRVSMHEFGNWVIQELIKHAPMPLLTGIARRCNEPTAADRLAKGEYGRHVAKKVKDLQSVLRPRVNLKCLAAAYQEAGRARRS